MGVPGAHFLVECAQQRGRIKADLLQCRCQWRCRITKRRKRNVLNADMRMLEALRLGQGAAVKRWAFGLKSSEQFFLLTFVDHHKALVQPLLMKIIRDSCIGSCRQDKF